VRDRLLPRERGDVVDHARQVIALVRARTLHQLRQDAADILLGAWHHFQHEGGVDRERRRAFRGNDLEGAGDGVFAGLADGAEVGQIQGHEIGRARLSLARPGKAAEVQYVAVFIRLGVAEQLARGVVYLQLEAGVPAGAAGV